MMQRDAPFPLTTLHAEAPIDPWETVDIHQTLHGFGMVRLELNDPTEFSGCFLKALQPEQCPGDLQLGFQRPGLPVPQPLPMLQGLRPLLKEIANAREVDAAIPLVGSRRQSRQQDLLAAGKVSCCKRAPAFVEDRRRIGSISSRCWWHSELPLPHQLWSNDPAR